MRRQEACARDVGAFPSRIADVGRFGELALARAECWGLVWPSFGLLGERAPSVSAGEGRLHCEGSRAPKRDWRCGRRQDPQRTASSHCSWLFRMRNPRCRTSRIKRPRPRLLDNFPRH